jgi:hypothetical protein
MHDVSWQDSVNCIVVANVADEQCWLDAVRRACEMPKAAIQTMRRNIDCLLLTHTGFESFRERLWKKIN